MNRNERTQTINQLKQDGFRVVKNHPDLYINENGTIYSLTAGKTLKTDSKNRLLIQGKRLNVPKLILEAFKGEPYNGGQVVYIDGDNNNMALENLKYSRILPPNVSNNVDKADMLTAIRCYFEVEKRFNLKNTIQTKLYLQGITAARQFFDTHKKAPHIGLFNAYVSEILCSKAKAAKSYGIETRDGTEIINGFLNELTKEVLADLKNGVLILQDYKPAPKSNTQLLKEFKADRDKLEPGKK
ncbi:hypothetical protein [uncultured Sunxiuqinia sp.]|uniref:hypothetical protein n=1 Tax=uncultured Sunxiuqinia sp. TaxID=1573825 RepID=UPI002AA7F65C|nr:hypothetical protein [uncultured Sunxiuqinia sp.]